MLVLTRKVGQRIAIGDEIEVVLVGLENGQARLGISAPRQVSVHRQEVYDRIAEENRLAAGSKGESSVLAGLSESRHWPAGNPDAAEFAERTDSEAHAVLTRSTTE